MSMSRPETHKDLPPGRSTVLLATWLFIVVFVLVFTAWGWRLILHPGGASATSLPAEDAHVLGLHGLCRGSLDESAYLKDMAVCHRHCHDLVRPAAGE